MPVVIATRTPKPRNDRWSHSLDNTAIGSTLFVVPFEDVKLLYSFMINK